MRCAIVHQKGIKSPVDNVSFSTSIGLFYSARSVNRLKSTVAYGLPINGLIENTPLPSWRSYKKICLCVRRKGQNE